jgi:hypothetical protein
VFDVNVRLKDQFQHGFLIFLHKSEPVHKKSAEEDAEEDDVEIIYTGSTKFTRPKIEKSVIGVIQMSLRHYLNPVQNGRTMFHQFFRFFPKEVLKYTTFQYPTRKQTRFLNRYLESKKLVEEDDQKEEEGAEKGKKEEKKGKKAPPKAKKKDKKAAGKKPAAKKEGEEEAKEVAALEIPTNEITVMLKDNNEIIKARKE